MEKNTTITLYNKLYDDWKSVNEKSTLESIAHIALDFSVDVLKCEKCVLFFHDDATGLFKVAFHKGYTEASQRKFLTIINLLLSGEIIDRLRNEKEPILYLGTDFDAVIEKFLKSLFLKEAYIDIFAGDIEVPFGLFVAGNSDMSESSLLQEEISIGALNHLVKNLSNAVNNVHFYKAWEEEKAFLHSNIALRTQELSNQKEQFEAIYRNSKDGIALLDVHTTAFLDANDAYLEMTGFTLQELLRTSCMKLTKPEDIENSKVAIQMTIEKGFLKDFIKSCIIKDGKEIIVNMSMVLLHDKNHLLVTAKDMTGYFNLQEQLKMLTNSLEIKIEERTKELESALKKAESAIVAKGNFLATMSHEIRTPMNGVLGMATLLTNTPLDSEQKEFVDVIINSGKTLLSIINDILDFSKIDAGKLLLEAIPINVKEFAANLDSLFKTQIDAKNLSLTIHIDPNIPPLIVCDLTRLRQIFFNLISNAIKFTNSGGIDITLKKTTLPDVYEVSIADSGIGMSEDILSKIFNPFEQADSSTTRHYGGTGLGLSICSKLVELMDGTIRVESKLGHGSTFNFTFKAPTFKGNQHHSEEESHMLNHQHLDLNVLVVEDNHVNRIIVGKILEKLNITPDNACDGLEALSFVQEKSYDLILMDMHMPNLDGLGATKAIRAMGENILQPKIIALTANAFEDDQEACKQAGMDDFLSKPIDFQKLSLKIHEIAEKQ